MLVSFGDLPLTILKKLSKKEKEDMNIIAEVQEAIQLYGSLVTFLDSPEFQAEKGAVEADIQAIETALVDLKLKAEALYAKVSPALQTAVSAAK